MSLITTTDALTQFCRQASNHPYVTVDTEFLRERTYYSQLCLLQMAMPGKGDDGAVLVDTLADGLDLAPVYELFRNPGVVKVFHAARQDLEIFYTEGGVIPEPFFDTQVAAMVCGFGDQVGYETLARQIAHESIDKSSRFTDWSQRPLNDKQIQYALADVTHLRVIYEHLVAKLKASGRDSWMAEELAILTNPSTYVTHPDEAWERIKTRTNTAKFLVQVKELARFREEMAIRKNIPRSRILKDDALLELASLRPKTLDDLAKARLLRDGRRGEIAEGILAAVRRALDTAPADMPQVPDTRARKQGSEGLADLLRVLLKAKSEETGVAQKLIASSSDLEEIADMANPDVPAMHGWRREVFGNDAERLKRSEIALSADGAGVKIIEL